MNLDKKIKSQLKYEQLVLQAVWKLEKLCVKLKASMELVRNAPFAWKCKIVVMYYSSSYHLVYRNPGGLCEVAPSKDYSCFIAIPVTTQQADWGTWEKKSCYSSQNTPWDTCSKVCYLPPWELKYQPSGRHAVLLYAELLRGTARQQNHSQLCLRGLGIYKELHH